MCSLEAGSRELRAVCSNIGPSGLYVRVPHGAARENTLESGARIKVSFRLPVAQELISSEAVILWTDPDDRDAAGRPSTGLGLRLEGTDPRALESIAAFIETFRYAVLVVDNNVANLETLKRALEKEYRVITSSSVVDALETLETTEIAVVVADERVRAISGAVLSSRTFDRAPTSHALQINLAAQPGSRHLEEIAKLGQLFHVLKKPFEEEDLLLALRRAVDAYSLGVENERLSEELERANHRLERENRYLRRRLEGFRGFESIVGHSSALSRSLAELERIRHSDAPVHIRGEIGTGKELVARALHFGGARSKAPFIAQHCGGLPETMLQSALFGHRRNAFIGADRDRSGVFQEAHGGTLFLDEVSDLLPSLQAALLRALQEKEIVALGDTRALKVDVRIISASRKDLRTEVAAGRFREDLYFRLAVIGVTLPPLRDRSGDIALLAQHFLDLLCEKYGKNILGFTHEAIVALETHYWPGNVRELENEIERLVVLSENNTRIPAEHLSATIHSPEPTQSAPPVDPRAIVILDSLPYDEALRRAQIELIERAMARSGGLVSRAAESLGIERSRLVKLRQRLGLV